MEYVLVGSTHEDSDGVLLKVLVVGSDQQCIDYYDNMSVEEKALYIDVLMTEADGFASAVEHTQ